MKDGTTFRPETAKAILLIGNSGSGKTNMAAEFPRPAFIDWGDANLSNAIARHPNLVFKFGRVDEDASGKPVAPHLRWVRATELLGEAGRDPDVQTIVDDSLSMLETVLKDYLIDAGAKSGEKLPAVAGERQMNMALWEPFQRLLRSRVITARSFGKTYIMTCHVKIDDNELTTVKEQRPMVAGAMASKLASLFTDYWMTEAIPSTETKYAATRGIRYLVRTAPTIRVNLKSSFPSMKAEEDASWFGTEAFQQLLRGGAK